MFDDFWYDYGSFVTVWLIGMVISGVLLWILAARECKKDNEPLVVNPLCLFIASLLWPFTWVLCFLWAMKQ